MGTHVYKWLIMICVKPLSLYRSPCWRAESLGLWPKDHSRYEHFRLCPWILLDSVGFRWIIQTDQPNGGFMMVSDPKNHEILGTSGYTRGGPQMAFPRPHNCHHFGL